VKGPRKKSPRPERTQTDESLAGERAKADAALGKETSAIEAKADEVLERAREEADEVLTAARAKADEKVLNAASGQTQTAMAEERAAEDKVVDEERAKADEVLRRERAASARLLARLLPLERERTDQFLLTERARADDALANRDDFLGMVSHDLRDLLHGIVMNAAYIAENAGEDEKGKMRLGASQRVQRSAGRMARLIGDLVDIASIDAGKLAVTRTPTNAVDLVLDAVETWGPPAANKGLVLEARASKGPVPALADSERIAQVLGNLITNAVKFSPRDTTIVVGVDDVGGEARFSVADQGVGIPEDKLQAIFERFWQVGTNDRRGLGLGLYISKCLVQAHGGTIWAESTLGVGTTFYFTIPRA
jgi:signal transduction histidine kinase